MPDDPSSLIRPLCVIPVFNHAATLLPLVRQARDHIDDMLVVDDGSTDADIGALLADEPVTLIRHDTNRGKGMALRTAFEAAHARGFTHIITFDADGQHAPADLPHFLDAIRREPTAVVMGVRDFSTPHVPGSSRFGRSFSNFWVTLETGTICADTQCGYRAYPVELIMQLSLSGKRYNFEIEILVRALWAGLPRVDIPVITWYPPPGERISHFHKGWDNLLLTHTHVTLVTRRLWPWPTRRLLPRKPSRSWRQLLHPAKLLKRLLQENATPVELGASAGVGTFLAILPIPGFHSLAILYVTTRLNLNRIMALTIQNLFIPPFTPGLCIVIGHLLLHGTPLPRFPRSGTELLGCLGEWVIGALVLAPLLAALFGLLVYWMARRYQRTRTAATTTPQQNVRGNAAGFWFFRTALRLTGLRGAYGLLYFVCPYYALFDRAAVAAAEAYVRRRFPAHGAVRRRLAVTRLFINQGQTLIDRHAHNTGWRTFVFDTDALTAICNRPEMAHRGFVLLLAHAGGWQLALPHLGHLPGDRSISLLMRAAETPDVRGYVRGDDAGFHVISPDDGPGCVVEMVTRLQRGEIVSTMGDRAYGGQTAEVPFLGDPARFPASAFAVARAAQCPVVALFVPKTGVLHYRIEAVLFDAPATGDRQAVRAGVNAFAQALEAFTTRHPYQCFLFEDIWTPKKSSCQ